MPDHEGDWTIDRIIETVLDRARGDTQAREALLAGFAETSGRTWTWEEFEEDFRRTASPILAMLHLAGFKVSPPGTIGEFYRQRSVLVDRLRMLGADCAEACSTHAAISVIEEACVALVANGSAEYVNHMVYAVGSALRAGQQIRAETLAARYGIPIAIAECPHYPERGA